MRLLPIACSLVLLAGSAHASPPGSAAAVAPEAEATAASATEDARKDDRNCVRHTGSRIKSKDKGRCLPVSGRSYSKEDLDRTGAISVAEALQRLDPAISRGF